MERMFWLDEYKDIIICLYKEGMKQIDIANEFEVSQTAISLRLRKWDASNSDGNRFIRNEISKSELYDMYWNREMHPSQIAESYNCSKQTITNNLIKYDIPRRTKSEARMGPLNPLYGVGHTKETRKKMSDAFINGKRKKFGFSKNWGKGAYYNTPNQGKVWMRSGWEVKVADYLTKNYIDWYYEYIWLDIGEDKHYLPDFFLPEHSCYIEVKGRKKKKDMEKFELTKNKYKVLLWDGEELLERGIITNSGNTEINRKYRNKEKENSKMPLYDFKCEECDLEVEILKKMDEKAPNCPVCGRSMVKLVSATNFILNGKNWEKDGYGLRSKKKGESK